MIISIISVILYYTYIILVISYIHLFVRIIMCASVFYSIICLAVEFYFLVLVFLECSAFSPCPAIDLTPLITKLEILEVGQQHEEHPVVSFQ